MLVDCDIHVGYHSLPDLLPHLDSATAELVLESGTNGLGMPSYPWYHPQGWLRGDTYDRDATAEGAQLVGQTLERVRDAVLDPFDVTVGILTPDEAAAFAILPNPLLAAALCRGYNDWLLAEWLEREPRLRGLLVVTPQHPEAAAAEIRRLGEREEIAGVFLPGAARIPYGNPVHDPIWRACDDLGLPVAVHTHFEGVGIAGPVTGAGMPDFYTEYHALTGAAMFGHFASILCHGIFERFPRTRVMFIGRRARSLRRAALAAQHGLARLPHRGAALRPAAVGVRARPPCLDHPAARGATRGPDAGPRPSRDSSHSARCASQATTRTGTSTTRAKRSSGCAPNGATRSRTATRPASSASRPPYRHEPARSADPPPGSAGARPDPHGRARRPPHRPRPGQRRDPRARRPLPAPRRAAVLRRPDDARHPARRRRAGARRQARARPLPVAQMGLRHRLRTLPRPPDTPRPPLSRHRRTRPRGRSPGASRLAGRQRTTRLITASVWAHPVQDARRQRRTPATLVSRAKQHSWSGRFECSWQAKALATRSAGPLARSLLPGMNSIAPEALLPSRRRSSREAGVSRRRSRFEGRLQLDRSERCRCLRGDASFENPSALLAR